MLNKRLSRIIYDDLGGVKEEEEEERVELQGNL